MIYPWLKKDDVLLDSAVLNRYELISSTFLC